MVAAVVSIIVEYVNCSDHCSIAWIEGVAILIAIAISSGITTANDYAKQKQFALLNNVSEDRKKVNILRDGQVHTKHYG